MYFWVLRTVALGLFKTASLTVLKNTKLAKWTQEKLDQIYRYVETNYGIDILNKEEVRLQEKIPQLLKRLKKLEKRINYLEKTHDTNTRS